jgi:hypothetical protein
MGILDGLEPIKNIEPCKMGRIIIELEPSDAQILIAALEDPKWTARALTNALASRGLSIARDTLDSHMKRTCRCSKI